MGSEPRWHAVQGGVRRWNGTAALGQHGLRGPGVMTFTHSDRVCVAMTRLFSVVVLLLPWGRARGEGPGPSHIQPGPIGASQRRRSWTFTHSSRACVAMTHFFSVVALLLAWGEP